MTDLSPQDWTDWTRRADDPLFWTLRLKRALGLRAGMMGAFSFLLVLSVLALSGVLPLEPPSSWSRQHLATIGNALFFSLSIGYLLEMTLHVLPASRDDLQSLSPVLSLEEATTDRLLVSLSRYGGHRLVIPTLIGGLIGVIHAGLLGHFESLTTDRLLRSTDMAFSAMTVVIWVLMMQVATVLSENARLFSELGDKAAIVDLLSPDDLQPFGRNALRPMLFILGLQTLYPLTMLGGSGLDPYVIIGLIASVGLIVWLYLLSLRGIHRTLLEERNRALARVEDRLTREVSLMGNITLGIADVDPVRLDALLSLRERLKTCRTWPVGSAVLMRILLYGIIPPLGWLSAALVQIGFEALLGG